MPGCGPVTAAWPRSPTNTALVSIPQRPSTKAPSGHRHPFGRLVGLVASSAVADVAGVPVAAVPHDASVWGCADGQVWQVGSPAVANVAGVPVAAVSHDAL